MIARSIWRVLPAMLIYMLVTSCGGGESESGMEAVSNVVMEETGYLEGSDQRDPDHSDLSFDPFLFEVEAFDKVHIELTAEGFISMLKLVEISTGAVLAEWDSEYADDDMLEYTIAASGAYEARVYSMDGGEGEYAIVITVLP